MICIEKLFAFTSLGIIDTLINIVVGFIISILIINIINIIVVAVVVVIIIVFIIVVTVVVLDVIIKILYSSCDALHPVASLEG